jgi:aspartyl-tRNA(Asn)/glutamyl-tRNA(Gln) amidotransferase subunit A
MADNRTIPQLTKDLRAGVVSARQLVEEALDRIDDPAGEGARTFMTVWQDRARDLADYIDRHKLWKNERLPLCGIPMSVKDVFDVAGEITRAGSIALEDQPSAAADAEAVSRLRAAGAILIGRTTMSEFAFSGIGLNHHFGTPRNPWDRGTGRIAGGSSSGSAVAVTDGMCAASLASDTGGSIRAPAALCGLTGFKPTASPALLQGVFPRSYSLDTVGPIGRSVSCCAIINAALSGPDATLRRPSFSVDGLRLGVVEGEPTDDLAPEVAEAHSKALSRLSALGARLVSLSLPEIEKIRAINSRGGISPPEAFAIHRDRIATRSELIDPIFLARLRKGKTVRAADYVDAQRQRKIIMAEVHNKTRQFDAILMPTCPVVAPPIAEVQEPEAFEKMSALILRNCNLANFLDRPALSIPIHPPGTAPVGLMLIGEHGRDGDLLKVGLSVEDAIAEASYNRGV